MTNARCDTGPRVVSYLSDHPRIPQSTREPAAELCLMARSIHATARHPRDPGDRARKRRVNELVIRERASSAGRVEQIAVPIVVCDRGPFVHYPLTELMLQRFIARLPAGAVEGIAEIEFLLCDNESDADEVDPLVGRLSREIAPGVFGPRLLGRCYSDGPKIQLFGYVYDALTPQQSCL